MSSVSELERLMPRESSLAPAYRAVNDLVNFVTVLFTTLVKLVIPHMFTLLGLGSFVVAAFSFTLITGFIVLGASFFIFEWRVSESR